jgi:hypothetical protein
MRYFIERKKPGGEFYFTQVRTAPVMADALRAVAGEFNDGDEVRVTILSVEWIAVRDSTLLGGWNLKA